MATAIASGDNSRGGFLKAGAGGIVTGMLTPLFQLLVDRLNGSLGDVRIALLALPFAILVLVLVRRNAPDRWWSAVIAAVVTMIAFVCAVNAAVWIDGQMSDAERAVRNILAGLAGGFTGATLMVLGICLLPGSPRDPLMWLPMLVIGTCAGALLALDNALGFDMVSILYPVWQAGVAICLAMALQRAQRT